MCCKADGHLHHQPTIYPTVALLQLRDACRALLDYAVDPAQFSGHDVAGFIDAGNEALEALAKTGDWPEEWIQ